MVSNYAKSLWHTLTSYFLLHWFQNAKLQSSVSFDKRYWVRFSSKWCCKTNYLFYIYIYIFMNYVLTIHTFWTQNGKSTHALRQIFAPNKYLTSNMLELCQWFVTLQSSSDTSDIHNELGPGPSYFVLEGRAIIPLDIGQRFLIARTGDPIHSPCLRVMPKFCFVQNFLIIFRQGGYVRAREPSLSLQWTWIW